MSPCLNPALPSGSPFFSGAWTFWEGPKLEPWTGSVSVQAHNFKARSIPSLKTGNDLKCFDELFSGDKSCRKKPTKFAEEGSLTKLLGFSTSCTFLFIFLDLLRNLIFQNFLSISRKHRLQNHVLYSITYSLNACPGLTTHFRIKRPMLDEMT